jgi:hypothetical protein
MKERVVELTPEMFRNLLEALQEDERSLAAEYADTHGNNLVLYTHGMKRLVFARKKAQA